MCVGVLKKNKCESYYTTRRIREDDDDDDDDAVVTRFCCPRARIYYYSYNFTDGVLKKELREGGTNV